MALSVFGVTADAVRSAYFPHQAAFSPVSVPTAAVVATRIIAVASELDAALRREDIDPAAITDAALAAYRWCADTIELGVALRLLEVMSGKRPEASKTWERRYVARLKDLDAHGAAALGEGASAPTISAAGPDDHIQTHSLDTGNELDVSDAIPRFRRDDHL